MQPNRTVALVGKPNVGRVAFLIGSWVAAYQLFTTNPVSLVM